jgi:hypothetical protein
MLVTPYYRTLTPTTTQALGCIEEPDFTYGPYDIFCIETRLYPILYKLYGRNVEMIFKGVHKDNQMQIKISLRRIANVTIPKINEPISGDPVIPNEREKKILEEALNKILSVDLGYCVINKDELYRSSRYRYPKSWFNTMLGYIQIPTEYNPFLKQEGIYLAFNPEADYNTAYNDVVKTLLDGMEQYYKDGVVYGAGNIAKKWKLERLDYETVKPKLYRATWPDKRFAPFLVDFLIGKIHGDPYIRIRVSDNLVKRHYIAKHLNDKGVQNYLYDGTDIKVGVENLDEAQYISALVMLGQKKDYTGKVITYTSNRESQINKLKERAKEIFPDFDCTSYLKMSVERPYVFSCLVSIDSSGDEILSKLTLK